MHFRWHLLRIYDFANMPLEESLSDGLTGLHGKQTVLGGPNGAGADAKILLRADSHFLLVQSYNTVTPRPQ